MENVQHCIFVDFTQEKFKMRKMIQVENFDAYQFNISDQKTE